MTWQALGCLAAGCSFASTHHNGFQVTTAKDNAIHASCAAKQAELRSVSSCQASRLSTPAPTMAKGISDAEAERQLTQMINFIQLEAREKAEELRTKVRRGGRGLPRYFRRSPLLPLAG